MSVADDRLRRLHAQLEQTLAFLEVHLSVVRLESHARSLTDERLVEAASEYETAQRHLDSLVASLEPADDIRHGPAERPLARRRSPRARKH